MSTTSPRSGVVQKFENGFWSIQLDSPHCIDHVFLRPWQFRFSATNPQLSPAGYPPFDGRNIWPGQRVELHYIVARDSGLWYAYPTTQKPATPPETE